MTIWDFVSEIVTSHAAIVLSIFGLCAAAITGCVKMRQFMRTLAAKSKESDRANGQAIYERYTHLTDDLQEQVTSLGGRLQAVETRHDEARRRWEEDRTQLEDNISRLRKRIQALETDLDVSVSERAALTARLAAPNAQVVELNTQIASLNARIGELTTEIVGLKSRIADLEGKLSVANTVGA